MHKKIGSCYRNIVQLASTYDFDWSLLENIFKALRIRHRVKKYISPKGHKSSTLTIGAAPAIMAFCNFIYDGYDEDKMGFPRKNKVYEEIKAIYPSMRVTSERLMLTTPLFETAISQALEAKRMAS